MKKIGLEEKQINNLVKEIINITKFFKKQPNVDCIYFATYDNLGGINGDILNITIVSSNDKENDIYKTISDKNHIYSNIKSLEEYGMKIFIEVDDAKEYQDIRDILSYESRSIYLANSSILYDKTGEYTSLRDKTKQILKEETKNRRFENAERVFPNINRTIKKQI